MRFSIFITSLIFILLSSFSFADDTDMNGIEDKFDVVINPLDSPDMRVAARQLVFVLQELIDLNGEIEPDYAPQLGLTHLIANECFDHARLINDSTVTAKLFWFSIVQIAASDTDRQFLAASLELLNPDAIDISGYDYQSTYERLSPFHGEFSGCDHLNL